MPEILNRTPLKFAYLPHRKNFPGHSLTLIVKGTFRLVPDGVAELAEEQLLPTGDEPYPDDDEGRGAPRYENDFAPFKPRTDLLLVGSCYPPGGAPVPVSRAIFRVGGCQKMVGVIGDRQWKGMLGGKTNPVPFTRMEIRYENAFGGPKSKRNPIGKGHGKSVLEDGSEVHLLPNIEDPRSLVTSTRDRPDPAGFGPLSRTWEDRFKKTGSYKGDWLKKRFPALPSDFNWGYYNCGPADHAPPYLRGDEQLFAENVHPERSAYTSQLPGMRIRTFLQDVAVGDASPPYREIPMNLDTVWVDMDSETLVVVWRGVVEVQSEEFEEIGEILVVSEPLAEEPKPAESYRPLIAEMLREVYGDEEEELPASEAGEPSADDLAAADSTAADSAAIGAAPPEPKETPGPVPVDDEDAIPETEPADATIRIESREDLEALIAEDGTAMGLDLRGLDLAGLEAPEFDLREADLRSVNLTGANLGGSLLAGARLDGADLSRIDLRSANLTGASMVRCSLADASLEDADFSLANLEEATLIRARAEGASFAEATLDGANLDEIEAESAVFESASLQKALLRRGNFKSAYFGEAMLEGAQCHQANLENANWAEVRAAEAVLDGAKLSGFRATGCDLRSASIRIAKGKESIWAGATLDEADFSYSEMPGATFKGASLVGAKLNCADMPEAKFMKADLRGAEFKTMNLFLGSMEKANLTKADLSGSNMYGVEFLDAIFSETVGQGTNLKMTSQDRKR